jgi:hypothetical protein
LAGIGGQLEASSTIDQGPIQLVGKLLVARDAPVHANVGLTAGDRRGDLVDGDLRRGCQDSCDAEARSDPTEQEARDQADDDAEADEPEGKHGGMVAQDSERPGGTVTTAWALM